jgi:hypothetical protein
MCISQSLILKYICIAVRTHSTTFSNVASHTTVYPATRNKTITISITTTKPATTNKTIAVSTATKNKTIKIQL